MIVEIIEVTEGFGCLGWFFIFLFLMEIMWENPKIFAIILAFLSFCLIIKNIKKEQPVRCIINIIVLVFSIIYINSLIAKPNKMNKIYKRDFLMSNTEVTQELYESIMGSNPSYHQNKKYPVENISWYDAVYFCNKLSEKKGKTPVYEVNGSIDVNKWNYIPHTGNALSKVNWNKNANGFRLPTEEEWEYAARSMSSSNKYSGGDMLHEVGWYNGNSENWVHPVAKKEQNGFGLYDMTGNVFEWCWNSDLNNDKYRYYRGGSYCSGSGDFIHADACQISYRNCCNASDRHDDLGFRIVCSISE